MSGDARLVRASAMTPAEIAGRHMLAQVYRDVEEMMARADALRAAIEDSRSRHRNGNRLLVLTVALLVNLSWSGVMLGLFHTVTGAIWTSSVAAACDMAVTAYALWKRY